MSTPVNPFNTRAKPDDTLSIEGLYSLIGDPLQRASAGIESHLNSRIEEARLQPFQRKSKTDDTPRTHLLIIHLH